MLNEGKKIIALSFDDGPTAELTETINDLVESSGIAATYFVVGQNITQETEPFLRRAHDIGIEINNHSFSHSYMDRMEPFAVRSEVKRTSDLIFNCTGEYPKFFRPPYIAVSESMYESVGLPFICGIGCNDWDPSVSVDDRVFFLASGEIPDGSIILLHDQPENAATPEALRIAIPRMRELGYEFVTLSELFRAKGIVPEAGRMYSCL